MNQKIVLKCILFLFAFMHMSIFAQRYVQGPFLPENTQLQFDLDETILQKNRTRLWINIIKCLDYRFDLLLPLLFTNINHFFINCAIGHPWNMYQQAIERPELRPYINCFLDEVASSHQLVPGVCDILMRLKQKGYSIAYATNKDRISYEYTAAFLKEPFSSLADKVLVTFKEQSDPVMQNIKRFIDTAGEQDKEFADMLQDVYLKKSDDRIVHAYVMKPSSEYVAKQREIAGDKKVIFFDDLLKNVQAVSSDQNMIGVQVFQNAQSILEPLFMVGIFSHDDALDQALFVRLCQQQDSGILKKISGWWYAIKRFMFPPLYIHMPVH